MIRAGKSDPFFQGQRVRLNQRGIIVFSKANAPGRRAFVDWGKRIGTVVRMVGNRTEVMIIWDGHSRRTLSALSVGLLELAVELESTV